MASARIDSEYKLIVSTSMLSASNWTFSNSSRLRRAVAVAVAEDEKRGEDAADEEEEGMQTTMQQRQ